MEELLNIAESEIGNGYCAIRVFSELLNDFMWVCSNEAVAGHIKKEDCFVMLLTLDELRYIAKKSHSLVGRSLFE